MKKNKNSWFALQIGVAVCLGCVVGLALGERASVLGELGTLLIRLLKTLATPLIFFAIIDAFCKTQIPARSGARLVAISLVNAVVAGGIALFLASMIPLGVTTGFRTIAQTVTPTGQAVLTQVPSLDFLKTLGSFIPQNILEPFITNNVISVVILSVLVGLVFRKLKKSPHSEDLVVFEKFFAGGLQLVSGLLSWIVKGVPIAAFGVVAKTVGTSGLGFLSSLGFFVLLVGTGIFLHGFVYYSLLLFFVARTSPIKFFKNAGEALMTAFGTGSSLATLPVTLRTLQEKMKISAESSRLAACIGTNLNHDGILLYEAMAALFIAQIHGIQIASSQKVILLLSSAVAAIGIAGVPEAGLITLSLVLTSVGLPLTLVPVLMTVDWLIGRFRSTANVTSDMVVATVLDRFKQRS